MDSINVRPQNFADEEEQVRCAVLMFIRIVIDDFVPTARLSEKSVPYPCFAGITGDGQVWVALVEKAFAKFCGSYAKTDWGEVSYAMHYLCGGAGAETWERVTRVDRRRPKRSRWKRKKTEWKVKRSKTHPDYLDREQGEGFQIDGRQHDENDIWKMLRRYMERCYPVACGVEERREDLCGLETDRMYSLIAAREVPASPSKVLRIVILRNPFDVGEWTGRWSDDSKAWEENGHVAENIQFRAGADGTFCMSYTDFLRYFAVITCVRKSMPIQGSHRLKLAGLKRGLASRQE